MTIYSNNVRRSRKALSVEYRYEKRGGRRVGGDLESRSWRSSLFSIFVTNFNWRYTVTDFRRIFSEFRVVVGVFLPMDRSYRRSRYAFVRFRFEEEYRRAIEAGFNLNVDGRKLVVRQAAERQDDSNRQGCNHVEEERYRPTEVFGKITRKEHDQRAHGYVENERRKGKDLAERQHYKGRERKSKLEKQGQEMENKSRQRRKYKKSGQSMKDKEVELRARCKDKQRKLSEEPRHDKEKPNRILACTCSRGKANVCTSLENEDAVDQRLLNEVNLDLNMNDENLEDLEWLFRSAIGFLTQMKDINLIQQDLIEGGLKVLVRRISDARVLLTFPTEEAMKQAIKAAPEVLQSEFLTVRPWVMMEEVEMISLWIKLEQVPLELWNINFFRSLGSTWGEFLEVDDNTEQKKSFDLARMKIRVKDRGSILDHAAGQALGVHFNIDISVEELVQFSTVRNEEFPKFGATETAVQGRLHPAEHGMSDTGNLKGAPLGNGWEQKDDSLTLIMGPTAMRQDSEGEEHKLPTEDFLGLCRFLDVHGEETANSTGQILFVYSNPSGPIHPQLAHGLLSENIRSNSKRNSNSLDSNGLEELGLVVLNKGQIEPAEDFLSCERGEDSSPHKIAEDCSGRSNSQNLEGGITWRSKRTTLLLFARWK